MQLQPLTLQHFLKENIHFDILTLSGREIGGVVYWLNFLVYGFFDGILHYLRYFILLLLPASYWENEHSLRISSEQKGLHFPTQTGRKNIIQALKLGLWGPCRLIEKNDLWWHDLSMSWSLISFSEWPVLNSEIYSRKMTHEKQLIYSIIST